MIKTILVAANGTETDAIGFSAAVAAARCFNAHVDALHARIDAVEVAVTMSTEGAGGTLLEGIIDRLGRDADEAEAKTRSAFAEFCARERLPLVTSPRTGVSARFHVETGQEPRWMAAYGLTADLAVASRGVPGNDAAARSTLEALLLETGRPILIPGDAVTPPDFAERVAIAWKPTQQAARAVAFALPFLVNAKDVVVLTVEEEERRSGDAARLVDYLAWHGVKAAAEQLTSRSESAADALLSAASARGAMLVMGGYGHTRLREWVFGGFTRSVLAQAAIPVLMAH